nr:AAA family ATPase [Spirulina major]
MKLREIIIKNFRNLVDVTIPIDDMTVLVGENNTGKTALLDALKIALPRRTFTGRATPFSEYDYYMTKMGDSPETSEGILIELWFREDEPNEWSEELYQALTEIVQPDPTSGIRCIGLRLSSKYDEQTKEIIAKWEFIRIDKQPLVLNHAYQLSQFLLYIRLFYLSALRDSKDEFSSRSPFWGNILKELKISEENQNKFREELIHLNQSLLQSDPRLEKIINSLDNAREVLELETGSCTSIQALPLQPFELMSKSEVVIRGRGNEIDFPLERHGQGTQNLAVIFLFKAYIDVLLEPTFERETEAILTLEEPEAHLHPQATRSLAATLEKIDSQKIISTHSPYFIQNIPFKNIRLFRRSGSSSKILYIKQKFTCTLPNIPKLLTFTATYSNKFEYSETSEILTLKGKMEDGEYKKLLKIYPNNQEVHTILKQLKQESQIYLDDTTLDDLEIYAKRIRGEVLFARAWLLCEGQCEYMLLQYFAELLETPLDRAGITVIDFKNNGSAGAFVGLARVFEIPWLLIADCDREGDKIKKEIEKLGVPEDERNQWIRLLPDTGMVLEDFLIQQGFTPEYLKIIEEQNISLDKNSGEVGFKEELAEQIKKNKTKNTIGLIKKLRESNAGSDRVPEFFAKAIQDIIEEVK